MKNDGYIIVTLAILLFVLLGFSALAVDLGMMYSARSSAQRAADAAALAGAFTFIVDPTSPQPATATQHAQQAAISNKILGADVNAGDVTVAVDTVNRRVTVDITRSENTFLGGALGVTDATVHGKAYAEASANSTGSYCVKPWFIPNTVVSPNDPCTACAQGQVLISNGKPTAYALSKLGTQVSVKPQQPSNAMTSGQFFAIQLPGSVGANDYRSEIGTCLASDVACTQTYSVETGDMVGPTKQGVRDLVGNPPTDTYVAVGQYKHADGTTSDTSRALIVAPIWDTCNMPNFCPANKFPNGTNVNVSVIGFAMIFLEGIQGNNVVARLINVSGCAAGGGAPGETGPYAVPLRLVRVS
jgi:Flp pilus assembly protein TadG